MYRLKLFFLTFALITGMSSWIYSIDWDDYLRQMALIQSSSDEQALEYRLELLRYVDDVYSNPDRYPDMNWSQLNQNYPRLLNCLDPPNLDGQEMTRVRNYSQMIYGTLFLGGYKFPIRVSVFVPDFGWSTIVSALLSRLVPALIAAIGLFLTIWAIYLIYRKFKRVGRA